MLPAFGSDVITGLTKQPFGLMKLAVDWVLAAFAQIKPSLLLLVMWFATLVICHLWPVLAGFSLW